MLHKPVDTHRKHQVGTKLILHKRLVHTHRNHIVDTSLNHLVDTSLNHLAHTHPNHLVDTHRSLPVDTLHKLLTVDTLNNHHLLVDIPRQLNPTHTILNP